MSIKTQKIVRFIPFINLLLIALNWILFYKRNLIPNKMRRIIGNLLIATAACLILMILEIILDLIIDSALIETVINLLVSFADMYIFSSVLIYDQEKFHKDRQKWSFDFLAALSGAAGFINSTFIRILGIYLQIPRICVIIKFNIEVNHLAKVAMAGAVVVSVYVPQALAAAAPTVAECIQQLNSMTPVFG